MTLKELYEVNKEYEDYEVWLKIDNTLNKSDIAFNDLSMENIEIDEEHEVIYLNGII